MSPLPPGVARHFAGAELDLDDPRDRRLAIERLLEDGDHDDLAWLGAAIPSAEIRAWFDGAAARRLSRRSRWFWAAVFGRPPARAGAAAEALWPLA